jgi:hypothetical protein
VARTLSLPRRDLSLRFEGFRQRRLSGYHLRMLLGIPSRWELDSFLKEHRVEKYTVEDFEEDWETIQKFREKTKA